ncbi:MAG TPA: alpha-glucan family phosphorylase, partial [Acidimicrobiales bacterium]
MRALRSFTVRPRLPERMAALQELAMNLRWSWDEQTRDLFRWVDPLGWDASRHDPVRLLGMVSRERLMALEGDAGFLRFLADVHEELRRYLDQPRWFQTREGTPLRSVAYFSPEFGIAEALPQYSGGLGVLAGDHLKTASDLGVPVVGVGLFYRHGYFRQALSTDGWQQERYPDLDPYGLALSLCDGVRVEVALAGTTLGAQVWRAEVGRVRLYLLDADIDENDRDGRRVTDRLYGGDTEHRLRQEILLGIGGVRAVEAVGESPQVFHTNEGHAGFLGLERIRRCIVDDGLTYEEALEAVRAGNIFTTHTPVPAGIDRFPLEMMARYFGGWAEECGIPLEKLFALGHRPTDRADEPFNMAVMGLRLAARSNAVSALHGEVSRAMFADLWPDVPEDEVPITHVTNGVHPSTWVSQEVDDLLVRHVLPEWQEAGPERWSLIDGAADDELWRAREVGRERLVAFVRRRLRLDGEARGLSPDELAWTDEVLDPRALTICFARRFATYKRATLLLAQRERLVQLLLAADRPVQFVFAGKAHPADDHGKEMIRSIVQFSRDPAVRHRFVFLEDYDIALARALVTGADVWLNNPRRPQEASGTSGMKAALNGALHCSILDGWWDELYDGTNGWAISTADVNEDVGRRDEAESRSLFELLERQIVPLFYERYGGGVPRGWVRRMKSSLRTLGPQVSAARMVRDYVERLYEEAARHTDDLAADGFARARSLAAWKARVKAEWTGVRVVSVDAPGAVPELGAKGEVGATVALGRLGPEDVQVQLLHGPVGESNELDHPETTLMTLAGPAGDGTLSYSGSFTCEHPGRYGYTVRVLPAHG